MVWTLKPITTPTTSPHISLLRKTNRILAIIRTKSINLTMRKMITNPFWGQTMHMARILKHL